MSRQSDFKAAAKTALIAIGVTVITLAVSLVVSAVCVLEKIAEIENLNRRWV